MSTWMQTFTGKAVNPLDVREEQIDIVDIAHSLSMQCRYNGHTKVFYSVAEHCVLMSRAVSPENRLWALLHDATETYMGDMIRPLKQVMPQFSTAEGFLMDTICDRFGIPRHMPEEVEQADRRILVNERDALMEPPPMPWPSLEGLERLRIIVLGWDPRQAEILYLDRFHHLVAERNVYAG